MVNFLDMLFNRRPSGNMLAPLDTRPDPQNYPVASPDMLASVQGPAPMPVAGQQVAAGGGRPSDFSFLTPDKKQFLQDMFIGWAAGSTPQQSLALGASQAAKGTGDRRAQNQTMDWLRGKGVSDSDAQMLASNPAALNEYIQNIYKPKKNDLINAGGSLYNPDTGEWITPPAGTSRPTEYGLQPVYGKDKDGNTVALQLSKDGTYKQITPPSGVQFTPGVGQVDTGTGTLLINTKTGEQVGQISKDVAGEATAQTTGKARGEAQAGLPSAEMTANMVGQQIQELKNDPYLPKMTGPVDARLPNLSGDAVRVQGKMDQLQGGAFLQARNMLKGGGAITDYEGAKAENAFARLQAAQNDGDYRQALDDFNEAVQMGLRKLQRQAGNVPDAGQPAQGQPQVRRYNPQTGNIE